MIRPVFLILVATASILQSCEYDYDIEKHFGGVFTPKVVLNSMITPDSLIAGDIYWTKHINDKSDIKTVDEFHTKLYEDDVLIFDAPCLNGKIATGIYPKAGSSYRVELTVPEYGEVKASTNIPTISTFTSSYDGDRGSKNNYNDYNDTRSNYAGSINIYPNWYWFYTIDNIVTTQKSRALWVRSVAEYSDKTYVGAWNLYLNNPFCDQINAVQDSYNVSLKGSEIGHERFMRISYKNITQSLPLKFSIMAFGDKGEYAYIGEDEWGYPIYEYVSTPQIGLNLLLITPSDDYDKYMKTAYRQLNFSDMGLPIFNEIINVYSNVENGVGIFAGYVAEKHKVEKAD